MWGGSAANEKAVSISRLRSSAGPGRPRQCEPVLDIALAYLDSVDPARAEAGRERITSMVGDTDE